MLRLFRWHPQPWATPALRGDRVPVPLSQEFSGSRQRSVVAHFAQSHLGPPPPSSIVIHRGFPEHLSNIRPCAGCSAIISFPVLDQVFLPIPTSQVSQLRLSLDTFPFPGAQCTDGRADSQLLSLTQTQP